MSHKNTPAAAGMKQRNTPETTAYVVISILAMLKTGARMGSQEVRDRLRAELGLSVSLRTVQRHIARLQELFPIEADGHNPRGYRWMTSAQAVRMRETALMMREAA